MVTSSANSVNSNAASIPSDATQSTRGSWRFIPWVVLLAGAVITSVATLYIKSSVEKLADLEFASQCIEIHNKIKYRLNEHSRILQSGVGLFNASSKVTREEWHIFTESQKLEQKLPGILGFGFSLVIPREDLARHVQEIRQEGFPDYKLKPDGDRDIYTAIIYLEPFSGRNLQAFGYDMYSEKVRRAAMERSRDMDYAALSGKVTLVQEIDKEVQAGTLMYVPVYRKGLPTETVEQRRKAIYGWVYSPYRMNDLLQGILGDNNLELEKQVRFQIFDGETPLPENLLYVSHATKDENFRSDTRFNQQIPLDFNGKRWTLVFTKPGNLLLSFDYIGVWFSLAGGMIITLLLFFLTRLLLDANAEAHRMVVERNEQLQERENLITELQAAIGEIRALQGILPICSYCKNIRNDDGYWEQVEAYIAYHSNAEFSHSICPSCLKKHYPDEYEGIMERTKQKTLSDCPFPRRERPHI